MLLLPPKSISKEKKYIYVDDLTFDSEGKKIKIIDGVSVTTFSNITIGNEMESPIYPKFGTDEFDMWATLDILVQERNMRPVHVLELFSSMDTEIIPRNRRDIASHAPDDTESLKNFMLDDQEVDKRFSLPVVRLQLEQLMGSNIVRVTDRLFMLRLQERIYEDHMKNLQKRITERQAAEVDREKRLILEGKLPVESAGKALAEHPYVKISQITSRIIKVKRSKIKPKRLILSYYPAVEDDTEIGLQEAVAVTGGELEGMAADSQKIDSAEQQEDTQGYMFTEEEYNRLKYESPLVKRLRTLETVNELYELADYIVGTLTTINN